MFQLLKIEYNSNSGKLQIGQKLFVDDLKRAIRNAGKTDFSLDQEQSSNEADALIEKYIKKHFVLKLNDSVVELKMLGKEWDDHHSIWCYFESNTITPKGKLTIHNSVFVDDFEEQQNLHHLKFPNFKKKHHLKKRTTAAKAFNCPKGHSTIKRIFPIFPDLNLEYGTTC